MTPDEKLSAVLTAIAGQLEKHRADQCLKRYLVAEGQLSTATVHHAFQGKNIKLSTLVTLAESLDCDLKIEILKRTA